MPIDPDFKKTRFLAGKEGELDIWGPLNLPEKLGIRGSIVAVDLDLCFGCLKCIDVCTVNVFEKIETSGHPLSDLKVIPLREKACFMCLACELVCPVDAILVERGNSREDTLQALLES
ncbi:MAG: 4Fe-4S dicluster domain-containing protein [Candidatus Helarchaeota archaeon]